MQFRIKHFSLLVLSLATCMAAPAAPEVFNMGAAPLGLPPVPIPAINPMTEAKVALGKKLFFDGRLSMNGLMSCAGCHMPEHGFADFLPLGFTAIGGNLPRNTPTSVNAAFNDFQFWDGRANSLENQIEEVYNLRADTSIDVHNVVKKVASIPEYVEEFNKVFGGPPSVERLTQAIAAYERTTISGDTRFDRFYFKGDQSALTAEEKQGFAIFMGKGNCNTCHLVTPKSDKDPGSALFIDQKFHNIGVGAYAAKRLKDGGRYLVTGHIKDLGKFKTPTLRNCELTGPYMHDGSEATLESVVEYYDRGGNQNFNLDPLMKPLNLTDPEKKSLVAFLKSLTDDKLAKLYVPVPELKKQLEETLKHEQPNFTE